MKKVLIIIFLLLGIGISNDYLAQSGGRKRERKNQRARGSLFKGSKSAGNADKFSKGNGRKGLFARLFKKDKPSWSNRSGSLKSNRRDNRHLMRRYRSKGKQSNDQIQAQQNKQREKRRIRGNKVFAKKKY